MSERAFPDRALDDEEYGELLAFRTALRRFLHWSDEQARRAGLTAQQHQLLLAIRGHAGGAQNGAEPTIGDIAESLLLRHHSAVELVDRAEQAGLVHRSVDDVDRRVVRLSLTAKGQRVLHKLSAAHLDELQRLAPTVARLARGLEERTA
ncbi:MAG TPA: MarR family winged helix-turn-helix transcriptional regulator [Acidimicrobiales bacterium]|nr:MarR family winged helix-turn-helix transcriptional regulator [Acidimicrobiales bacterium]